MPGSVVQSIEEHELVDPGRRRTVNAILKEFDL